MGAESVLTLTLITSQMSWTVAVLCPAGSIAFNPPNEVMDVCIPCRTGKNFMPEENHDKRRCYDCTQIRGYPEVLFSACNRTHDAEILCSEGYYRSKTKKSCVKCFFCDQPTRPCEGYHNTLCCGKPDSEAVLDEAGFYVCKDRSVQCGPGQFYSTTKDRCERCPTGTYMSFQTHVNTACWKCPVQSSDTSQTHSEILQECNRTSPTLFGCQPGYFRDPDQHELSVEVTCTPCQTCQYPGRTCDTFHDTVCCLGPDMQVVTTPHGYECTLQHLDAREYNETKANRTCPAGHYLLIEGADNSHRCVPCSVGTYLDESNHTETRCKQCPDHIQHTAATCRQEHEHDWLFLRIVTGVTAIIFLGFVLYDIYRMCVVTRRHFDMIKTFLFRVNNNNVTHQEKEFYIKRKTHLWNFLCYIILNLDFMLLKIMLVFALFIDFNFKVCLYVQILLMCIFSIPIFEWISSNVEIRFKDRASEWDVTTPPENQDEAIAPLIA